MLALRNKKFTIYITVVILATVALILGPGYVREVPEEPANLAYNADNLIRLHVVANSDSDVDQVLKLGVRDAVLEASGELLNDAVSVDEAWSVLKDNLDFIRSRAEQRISAAGVKYPVTVEIGEYPFPTKAYGNFVLAAGTYPAVKVEIGAANGHNWWCVLFPPLCFLNMSGPLAAERVKKVSQAEEESKVTVDFTNPFGPPIKPIPVVAPHLTAN